MTTDAWLAIAHHVAVFTFLAVLAMEFGLLRPGLSGSDVARLGRIDAAYGATAGVVLVIGVVRIAFGAKDWDFYSSNPLFWLKMASFATVGLLSIGPTRRYIRWRRADSAPDDGELRTARKFLHLQLAVFPLIPIFAALMARGIGN